MLVLHVYPVRNCDLVHRGFATLIFVLGYTTLMSCKISETGHVLLVPISAGYNTMGLKWL